MLATIQIYVSSEKHLVFNLLVIPSQDNNNFISIIFCIHTYININVTVTILLLFYFLIKVTVQFDGCFRLLEYISVIT